AVGGHRHLYDPMLSWLETRIGEIASSHEDASEKKIEIWAVEAPAGPKVGLAALLEERGYTQVTYGASMVRPDLEDIPDAALPAGLEVRAVEPDHLRTIWEADREAFRDHWGESEWTEENWKWFLEFPYRDESLWKIAWDGDEVAGQVKSFIDREENEAFGRERGWTEFISTGRKWRRQGVARALICESLRELKDRGMTEAALGVHVENPNGAYHLYESLGFSIVHRFGTYHKDI
ncbi:MAG: GNAT family N-acetyltransferase, partial [Acidimicrobiia bacterium]|nr:GNAT family N-acetyltransferase [Acidimicrobiia bacterium]